MKEEAKLSGTDEKQSRKLSILYEIALTVGKSLDLKTILDDALQ